MPDSRAGRETSPWDDASRMQRESPLSDPLQSRAMVDRSQEVAHELCAFLDASPTPFHACAEVARRLERAGFARLSEAEPWPRSTSSSPARHYVLRGGSLAAW